MNVYNAETAARYRLLSEKLRVIAERQFDPKMSACLQSVADNYEEMARQLDRCHRAFLRQGGAQ